MSTYHVGDTTPPLTGVCRVKQPDGAVAPVDDLSGSLISVHVLQPDRTVLTLTATSDEAGVWVAQWPGPIQQAGTHRVEVQVTYPDGKVQTFGPATFRVAAQIA